MWLFKDYLQSRKEFIFMLKTSAGASMFYQQMCQMFFSFYFCRWYCCCCRTAVQLHKKNAAITLCMKNINSISNTVIQHNITIILGPFYTSMLTIVSITLIWSNSLLRMTAVAKISTHTSEQKKITHTTNDITMCVH